MQNQLVPVLFISLTLALGFACGPTCPEAKTAMSPPIMEYDDATRLNRFVQKRKDTIAAVESGAVDKFHLDNYKFTVTACELAIQVQMRIINLAKRGNRELGEGLDRINQTRCLFDDILEKTIMPTISMANGNRIQEEHAYYKVTYGKDGELSIREYEEYYEKGVKAEKPAELIEQEKAEAAKKAGGKAEPTNEPQEPKNEESADEASGTEDFSSDDGLF